jgi:hypothetical protein
MPNVIKYLDDCRWKHPDYYGGFSPDGDYLICSQHRDSDALERSNYECIGRELGAEAFDDGREHPEERPVVYDFRARHWAVGWVDYLLVRSDASADILERAGEILAALSDYPVYNEEHFSGLEYNETLDYWVSLPMSERVALCRENGESIFAARRDSPPDSVYERLLYK